MSYTLNILNGNSYGLSDQSAKVEKQKSTKIQKKNKNAKKQKSKNAKMQTNKKHKKYKKHKKSKNNKYSKNRKNAIFIFSYTFFILHVFSAGVECTALYRYLCPRQGRVALLHPELNWAYKLTHFLRYRLQIPHENCRVFPNECLHVRAFQ